MALRHVSCRLKSVSRRLTVRKFFETSNFLAAPESMLLARISFEEQVLTDDTDVGQLVLSSCTSILFAPKERILTTERPTVYEAEIMKKETREGQDFMYICLHTKCIKDLALTDGCNVEVEIQFQLDSSFFCRLHEAVDAVKQSSNTRLLFPRKPIAPLMRDYVPTR